MASWLSILIGRLTKVMQRDEGGATRQSSIDQKTDMDKTIRQINTLSACSGFSMPITCGRAGNGSVDVVVPRVNVARMLSRL